MEQLEDIYILLEKFDRRIIDRFINDYLDGLNSQNDFFEYPQYRGATIFETKNYTEMIDFVIKNQYPYDFYFKSFEDDNIIKYGMIFLNGDHSLILGISTQSMNTKRIIDELKCKFETNYCLIMYEELPPKNAEDFKKMLK